MNIFTNPRLAGILALGGLVIYLAGIGWTMAFFGERHAHAYSPLNHFVSELSCPTLSPMAWVMNTSVSLGSLFIVPLVLALARRLDPLAGGVATVAGLVAALSAMLLGTSPMELITPHLIFAMGFFGFCMIETAVFTAGFWWKHSFRRAPVLLAAGVLTSGLSAGFLLMLTLAALFLTPPHFDLKQVVADFLAHPDGISRPAIWSVAVIEWSVVLSIFGWIAAGAFHLLKGTEMIRANSGEAA